MATAPPRRPRQPRLPIEVRRRQALDAALALISTRGYGAASMEAIAREVGIAKPVIYEAWGGREPLLQALLEREERRALQALADAVPDDAGDDLRAVAVAWSERALQAIVDDPVPWRLVLLPGDGTPEAVRERLAAGREVVRRRLREALEGLLPATASLDADLAAHVVLAAGEQAARQVLTDPEAFPPARYAAFTHDLLALLDPKGPPTP